MLSKPNLARAKCTRIELSLSLNLARDEIEKLVSTLGVNERDLPLIAFRGSYKVANSHHWLILFIHQAHGIKKQNEYHILMELRRGKEIEIIGVRETKDAMELLNFLIGLKKKSSIMVISFFEYDPKKYKSKIDLPIKFELLEGRDSEIRGLRLFVKADSEPEEFEYSHIIDLDRKGNIIHQIQFRIDTIMANALFEDILKLSSTISESTIALT